MQSCDASVRLDSLLCEHDGFLVPAQLERGLDKGSKYIQLELIDAQPFSAFVLEQGLAVVLTVVLDQVVRYLIDLERLLELLVLVEGVTLRLELLRIAELVIEIVGQVANEAPSSVVVWISTLRRRLSNVSLVLPTKSHMMIAGAWILVLQMGEGALHGGVIDARKVPITERLEVQVFLNVGVGLIERLGGRKHVHLSVIDDCRRSLPMPVKVLGHVEIVVELFVAYLRHGRSALEPNLFVARGFYARTGVRVARQHADYVRLEREHVVLVVERDGGRADMIFLLVFFASIILLLLEVDDSTLDICRHSALRR